MIDTKRERKNIFVILVVTLLACATLVPIVAGNSHFESEKSGKIAIKNTMFTFENKLSFVQKFKDSLIEFISFSRGLFSNLLITSCDDIEKNTEITLGVETFIDVDNNQNTGIDGKDIKVKYRINPWIDFENDIGIGLTFTFTVSRIGEEIKETDFTAFLVIGDKIISFGFWSPPELGNEVPGYILISFNVFFYLFQRTNGFGFSLDPVYSDGNDGKKIELFADYNTEEINRHFSIEFDPAIKTDISFITTKKEGVWNYELYRRSSEDCKVTANFITTQDINEKDVTLIIDKLPKEMVFTLGLTPLSMGGGRFLYESSEIYDIELLVTSNDLGTCRYSFLRNTPRRIFAEWIPTFKAGEYHIEIDSDGTDFVLKDHLENPEVILEVNNLETIDIDAYWNLTNPGDFNVYKNSELNVNVNFKIGDWIAKFDAQPTAKNISTTWFIDISGYMTIDTDWEPFTTMDLLIKAPLVGLHTVGETFKSDDFEIYWTLWPPKDWDLTFTGWIDPTSIVSIDLYLINNWYHLWPW